MKINGNCMAGRFATIYLDGKKLDYCFEADDAEGYVWVARDYSNPTMNAFPGDFLLDSLVVQRLTGNVEIKFDGTDLSDAELREDARLHYVPLEIVQKVQ